MDALKRLEQAGYLFGLDNGQVIYLYDPRDSGPPMSERPQAVQEVTHASYAADLAEVCARAAEVRDVLMARSEWGSTFDDRKAWLATQPDFDDPAVVGEDLLYRARLAWLSEAACWPFYDGGPVDQGPRMWRVLAELLRLEYETTRRPKPAATGGQETEAERADSSEMEAETMGIKIVQKTWTVLPEGEYRLRIRDVAESEGKFHEQLQFRLAVAEGEYEGLEFFSWMNKVFSPKSRLYQWVEAALAVPIPADYDLDTDDLLDREVIGTVIVKKITDGTEVNRVERVRAVRGVGRRVGGR